MQSDTLGEALDRLESGSTDSFNETQVVPLNPLRDKLLSLDGVRRASSVEPDYVIEPWVCRHAITLFDGVPKIGKTQFIDAMIAHGLRGEPFLGYPIKQPINVLYLSEQLPATTRPVLDRVGMTSGNIKFLFWTDTIGYRFRDIMEWVAEIAEEEKTDLLVIDTSARFGQLNGDAENNAGSVLEMFEPIHAAAKKNMGIVLVRHERKSGGSVGESGRGSNAAAGSADIICQFQRPEGNHPANVRCINSVSRFDGTPETLNVEWTGTEYRSLGTEAAYKAKQTNDIALEYLPSTSSAAIKVKVLADLINRSGSASTISESTLRAVLETLHKKGAVGRSGSGTRGDGWVYWRRADASSMDSTDHREDVSLNQSVMHETDGTDPLHEAPHSFNGTPPLRPLNESEPVEPEHFTYLDLDDPESEVQP